MELLLSHPGGDSLDSPSAVDYGASTEVSFRQLLVFGKESLRTLLMRQVLQDPHTRTFGKTGNAKGSAAANKNKNWDDRISFPLPRNLQTNVIGTKVLMKQKNSNTGTLQPQRSRIVWEGAEGPNAVISSPKDDDLFRHPDELFQHVDVITYFIRPWDMDQTMAVISRIKKCALNASAAASEDLYSQGKNTDGGSATGAGGPTRTHKQHHRIVYVPQITALCAQVLKDHRVYNPAAPNTKSVSVSNLQLDLFPLETDLISLECEDALRDAGNVGGMPSGMIETTSRALRKLQDVVGRIPRIQSLGVWGEEVLSKLLNETVDERYADENQDDAGEEYCGDEENEGDRESGNEIEDENDDNGTVMMLLDRRLDMVTPMVTPLTYEGLLDELVEIDCGFIGIPEQIINPSDDDENEDGGEGERKQNDKQKSTNPFDNDPSSSNSNNPFDDDTTTNSAENQKIVTLGVHAGDSLFAEVRDQHVEKFGSFLQNQAVALKESHANFTSRETKKDLNEIHQFVKQIPIFTQSLRSLTNHIHLAELIKATTEDVAFREQWNTERAMIEGESCYDILEECIFENYPPYKLLRLLCLQSLTSGGIKASRYDQLKQHIVQVYGYEFLCILHNLETMGWIKKMEGNLATNFVMDSTSRSLFQNIKRNLILIHAEVNTVEPDDVSYVSSGYAPLTVRLIQSAMHGWHTSDKDDILKDLFQMMVANNSSSGSNNGGGGRLLDVRQTYPPRDLPTTLRRQRQSKSSSRGLILESLGAYGKKYSNDRKHSSKKKPTLIVVYLGGITYMEIAALRFLSKRETFPYHIVVVTTRVLNGSKLIQQMG